MNKSILGAMIALTASALFAVEGVVTANMLNGRREPSLKAPVMVKFKKGDKVEVVAERENGWLELALPESAGVFVSEAYVSKGKAIADIRMYSGKGRGFPEWGVIRKGEPVKIGNERGYGWVNIEPPPTLHIYVYNMYIELKEPLPAPEAAKPADNGEAEKAAADPADEKKPAAAPEAAKPAPVKAPAAKPAPAKPAPAAKPAAPAKAPAAKPAPAKKPAGSTVTVKAPAAKPAPAKKPAGGTVTVKAPAAKPDKAMLGLGVAPDAKSTVINLKGTLVSVGKSKSKVTNFALTDDRGQNIGFVYDPAARAKLSRFVNERVSVQGDKFQIGTWKAPIIVVRWVKKLD